TGRQALRAARCRSRLSHGQRNRNRSRPPRIIHCWERGAHRTPSSAGRHPHVVGGAKEVPAMATTRDRLDELTRREWELDDHDVGALEDGGVTDGEVPAVAAGNR